MAMSGRTTSSASSILMGGVGGFSFSPFIPAVRIFFPPVLTGWAGPVGWSRGGVGLSQRRGCIAIGIQRFAGPPDPLTIAFVGRIFLPCFICVGVLFFFPSFFLSLKPPSPCGHEAYDPDPVTFFWRWLGGLYHPLFPSLARVLTVTFE